MTRKDKIKLLTDIQNGVLPVTAIFKAVPLKLDIYTADELNRLLAIKKKVQDDLKKCSDDEAAFLKVLVEKQLSINKHIV